MTELIVFCLQRTGSSVFGKWLTDAGFVDFKEIYALGYDYRILEIPTSGEAITEEYIPHCMDYSCEVCNDFEYKHTHMLSAFNVLHTPNKFLYKMFVSWHSIYCQQNFYNKYIKDKKKVLLIRRDFTDLMSSIALQNANIYLGHSITQNKVTIDVTEKLLDDLLYSYETLIKYVSDIDYIIIYEDVIRDKLFDSDLEETFGIMQNFNNHVAVIDNPYKLKKQHVSNLKQFTELLVERGYVDSYNKILSEIYQKYVVNGNAKIIGNLLDNRV